MNAELKPNAKEHIKFFIPLFTRRGEQNQALSDLLSSTYELSVCPMDPPASADLLHLATSTERRASKRRSAKRRSCPYCLVGLRFDSFYVAHFCPKCSRWFRLVPPFTARCFCGLELVPARRFEGWCVRHSWQPFHETPGRNGVLSRPSTGHGVPAASSGVGVCDADRSVTSAHVTSAHFSSGSGFPSEPPSASALADPPRAVGRAEGLLRPAVTRESRDSAPASEGRAGARKSALAPRAAAGVFSSRTGVPPMSTNPKREALRLLNRAMDGAVAVQMALGRALLELDKLGIKESKALEASLKIAMVLEEVIVAKRRILEEVGPRRMVALRSVSPEVHGDSDYLKPLGVYDTAQEAPDGRPQPPKAHHGACTCWRCAELQSICDSLLPGGVP